MKHNIFDTKLIESTSQEVLEIIFQRNANVKVERIVSFGHATPQAQWYDQGWDEWVMLVKGRATLEFEDHSIMPLESGDCLMIEAHRRHRVETVSEDAVWLAIHLNE